MTTDLLQAAERLKNKQALIPDDLIEKFTYCSASASRHVMDTYVFDGITPERDYRTALLQLYSKLQALTDLFYAESKRERDIERKRIKIESLRSKALLSVESERRLTELDILDLEEEILQIEDGRKLAKPLLDDALAEVEFYRAKIAQLEAQGLRPFEEAEAEYFQKKTAHDVRMEVLSNKLALSRPLIEEFYRQNKAQLEPYAQSHPIFALLSETSTLAAPQPAKPKLSVFVLLEREGQPLLFNPDKIRDQMPEYDVEFQLVPPAPDARRAVLEHISGLNHQAVILAGNLQVPDDFLEQLFGGHDPVDPPDLCMVQLLPEKYGVTGTSMSGFHWDLVALTPEAARLVLEGKDLKTELAGWQSVMQVEGIRRVDLDSGMSWGNSGEAGDGTIE